MYMQLLLDILVSTFKSFFKQKCPKFTGSIVNWIYLGFGPLVGQNNKPEDIDLLINQENNQQIKKIIASCSPNLDRICKMMWSHHHDTIPLKDIRKENWITQPENTIHMNSEWIDTLSSVFWDPCRSRSVTSPCWLHYSTVLQPTSASPTSGSAWRRPSPSFSASFWPS